jgi:hypothetical protein
MVGVGVVLSGLNVTYLSCFISLSLPLSLSLSLSIYLLKSKQQQLFGKHANGGVSASFGPQGDVHLDDVDTPASLKDGSSSVSGTTSSQLSMEVNVASFVSSTATRRCFFPSFLPSFRPSVLPSFLRHDIVLLTSSDDERTAGL